jgi:hypothetical protein
MHKIVGFIHSSKNSRTLRSGVMKFAQHILSGISRSTQVYSARYVVTNLEKANLIANYC